VSTTTINEELGQIEYVLTDKTGTLTQNKMILRGLCIGDKLFGGNFHNINKDTKFGPDGKEDTTKKDEFRFKIHSPDYFDQELEEYLSSKPTANDLPFPMDVWTEPMKKQNYGNSTGARDAKMASMRSVDPTLNLSKPKSKQFTYIPQFDGEDDQMNEFVCRDKKLFSSEVTGPRERVMWSKPKNKIGDQSKSALRDSVYERNKDRRRSLSNFLGANPSKERRFPKNLQGGTVFRTYEELTQEFLICAALNHECLIQQGEEGETRFSGSSPDEIAICQGAKNLNVKFLGNSLGKSTIDYYGQILTYEVPIVSPYP
jgi:magnesium-transporting ATPase (P-type)